MTSNKDRFRAVDYIGDGVYVGHDAYQVWVWASDGVTESPAVALNPGVLTSLIAYATRTGILRKST